MANVVITSTTNTIKVVWNNAATLWAKETWHKSSIHFYLEKNSNYVEAREDNGTSSAFSYNGSGNTVQVDSVDGVAPTSNSDLYDKLVTLLG